MSYRAPDAERLEAERREAARQQAKDAAAIAAMKDPLQGFSNARVTILVVGVALGVPLFTLLVSMAGMPAGMQLVAAGAAVACGWIGGIAAVVLGVVGAVRWPRGRAGGVVAAVAGVLALPWALFCAVVALFSRGW